MRRYPIGAELQPGGGAHFRVWAPACRRVEAAIEGGPAIELQPETGGYFSGTHPQARAGMLYRFRLDGAGAFPDPASRFQPEGPHGPSQVVDPGRFEWTDSQWKGRGPGREVIYEMHVGTFTREGTWEAAARELPELARLGMTVIELMPIADFCGRFGWGYDGVDLFAPTRLYGTPDDLRRFVNQAHAHGLGVILDVVYNHFGPDGNYLKEFSPDYFTDRYENEWGEAINFDGPNAAPVREFFAANAAYWVEEFHIDGLRLDATQQIFDASPVHILAEIGERVRRAAPRRATYIVAENEPQHTKLVRPPARGGYGLDALWNDDYHHSAVVALTGHNEAYYTDYHGRPQEFISALKYGYLYQGQRYKWQKGRRGTPARGLEPVNFVAYIENHDQVANSGRGARLHTLTTPGRFKAMTALLLLGPNSPMLFQGQEFASSHPFYFFADHGPELNRMVQEGRGKFLAQFRTLATPGMQACLAVPGDISTFERSRLDFSERERNAPIYGLHRDLIRLRNEHPAFDAELDGAVLGDEAFVLRFFDAHEDDRLLIVNFGRDLHLDPAPEPLLAPPEGRRWALLWSTEDPKYGGCGTAAPDTDENWRIPGHAAVVMRPEEGSIG